LAIVVLPAPESPVIQRVKPGCEGAVASVEA